MLEILVWSLLVGSLGIEGAIAGSWLYWQQRLEQQQQEEEEEFLTHYNSEKEIWEAELPQSNGNAQPESHNLVDPRLVGWEYKIVRASGDLFRDGAVLQKLRDEEAEAGWILLEKLDDRRVRFKRPIAMAKILDTNYLSFDPYRSQYGPTSNPLSLLGAMAAVVALALPAYLGYTLVSTTLDKSQSNSTPTEQPSTAPLSPTLNPRSEE